VYYLLWLTPYPGHKTTRQPRLQRARRLRLRSYRRLGPYLQTRRKLGKGTSCRQERSRWRGGHCLGVQLWAAVAAV